MRKMMMLLMLVVVMVNFYACGTASKIAKPTVVRDEFGDFEMPKPIAEYDLVFSNSLLWGSGEFDIYSGKGNHLNASGGVVTLDLHRESLVFVYYKNNDKHLRSARLVYVHHPGQRVYKSIGENYSIEFVSAFSRVKDGEYVLRKPVWAEEDDEGYPVYKKFAYAGDLYKNRLYGEGQFIRWADSKVYYYISGLQISIFDERVIGGGEFLSRFTNDSNGGYIPSEGISFEVFCLTTRRKE